MMTSLFFKLLQIVFSACSYTCFVYLYASLEYVPKEEVLSHKVYFLTCYKTYIYSPKWLLFQLLCRVALPVSNSRYQFMRLLFSSLSLLICCIIRLSFFLQSDEKKEIILIFISPMSGKAY